MKKENIVHLYVARLLVIFIVFLVYVMSASSQVLRGKHHFSLYMGFPNSDFCLKSAQNKFVRNYYGGSLASYGGSKMDLAMSVGMQYTYNISEMFSLGANVGVIQARYIAKTQVEGNSIDLAMSRNVSLYVMPVVGYYWLKKRNVDIYSKAGVGIRQNIIKHKSPLPDTNEHKLAFSYQVSPLGVRWKWIYMELGYATNAIVSIGCTI